MAQRDERAGDLGDRFGAAVVSEGECGAAPLAAGAAGLPFGILRGYVGTDLVDHTTVATIASSAVALLVCFVLPMFSYLRERNMDTGQYLATLPYFSHRTFLIKAWVYLRMALEVLGLFWGFVLNSHPPMAHQKKRPPPHQ
mgnify:CR=1 FL=1